MWLRAMPDSQSQKLAHPDLLVTVLKYESKGKAWWGFLTISATKVISGGNWKGLEVTTRRVTYTVLPDL